MARRDGGSSGENSLAGILKFGAPGKPLFVGLSNRSAAGGDRTSAGAGAIWGPTGFDSAGANQLYYWIQYSFDEGLYLDVVGYTTGVALELS